MAIVVVVVVIFLFSQRFSFWYFYFCTKGDTYGSAFMFVTAVPSVLRAILQVQLSFLFLFEILVRAGCCFFSRYWYVLDAVSF
jgi:hypothetical protein